MLLWSLSWLRSVAHALETPFLLSAPSHHSLAFQWHFNRYGAILFIMLPIWTESNWTQQIVTRVSPNPPTTNQLLVRYYHMISSQARLPITHYSLTHVLHSIHQEPPSFFLSPQISELNAIKFGWGPEYCLIKRLIKLPQPCSLWFVFPWALLTTPLPSKPQGRFEVILHPPCIRFPHPPHGASFQHFTETLRFTACRII